VPWSLRTVTPTSAPPPLPPAPRWLPTGVPPPRARSTPTTATGPVARPPRPRRKTGTRGEPGGRTRRRNRPDPAGRGAGQTARAASPPGQWPVRATPTRWPGPRGPTQRRGRLFCSLTIRSFVTQPSVVVALFHLHERGTLDTREIVTGRRPRRVVRRPGRRHRTSHPLRNAAGPARAGRDPGSAWSSPQGHGGDA
jgi:hypothetical protein